MLNYLPASSSVFVTGGSGFLGRQLIQDLVTKGFQVKALARSDKAAATVKSLGAMPVRGDLDDIAAMAAGMAGCAAVIHSAAKVEQWGKWEDFEHMTVQGSKNVIAATRQAGIKRLVHISTEAVLAGGSAIINADENTPLPSKPNGMYPLSKKLAEQAVLAANSGDLAAIIVRPRFIWGKGDTTLLPKLAEAARTGSWLWFDGGKHQMSTCHVRNVSQGVILAACHGRGGQIYFLTDGDQVNFRNFVTALIRTQGVEPGNKVAPIWLADAIAATSEMVWKILGLKGEPPITKTAVNLFFKEVTINDSKARNELGYVPVISVEAGLAELKV
ncbi:NAD-dependent epimerase [bacterium (Candidatus Blackallbacteria) CG17_big_fil_post_rev_8_21_14_2_50_48_46]|uniref:NAD-dependent epimerase n=1 Tax=bacterium (Candidatus Blackallbacteria) CG17_big_fil_post_rev_8_21_14_2_50_48_46 TaxID=2014261 RepID=A0A2M7G2C5_9BACT|nr:MAG: NAD-dependent epimerase [bacterium (Candidatus Blackallbacteria) CG18_big_fil_WC_8_21_14_2_50_49_26]PIW15514.1 MAG: NAD-dependent epimerase [bacterium (Candidatus Blackallbacteria) CG17_big_fil_post_rev_8_21_14_2_50_48_46]PIW48585.1 MAG: NAD-dependent epimerase [bacterium (Candidatus Blackallbacteria) CG13_big_fil_rev_8_21_14_2_50_49_14]